MYEALRKESLFAVASACRSGQVLSKYISIYLSSSDKIQTISGL